MSPSQTVSVSEMRDSLPTLIKQAAGGERITVGAHRKPEAALVGLDELARIPDEFLLEHMINMVARCTAHDEFCGPLEFKESSVWHPGDPFGRMLSWLWKTGRRDSAVRLVSDLLAEARYTGPHRPSPRPSFAALLNGIPKATSGTGWGVSDEESEEMVEYLRAGVPRYFSDDIDAP